MPEVAAPPTGNAETAPYALGFQSLEGETSLNDLPVKGTVPPWLTGTLMRVAPAKFDAGGRPFNHWFDGLAMLHKFAFSGGRVAYANRYLRSQAYLDATEQGRMPAGNFATDPCRTLFQRVAAFFSPAFTDNCNVNVARLADKVVALTETRLPIQFDPATLETLGRAEYDSKIKGPISMAHPHYDQTRRRHYSFTIEMGWRSRYHIFSIDETTGRQVVLATIPVDRPAYMHSFGMTERFLVLTEFPLVVNPLRMLLSGRPFIQNYVWEPQRGVRFYVIDKDTGERVRTAQSEPFFAFHHVNGFEEGDALVLDVVTYPDSRIIDQLYLNQLRSGQPIATGELNRFRLNGSGKVARERLSDTNFDLPRFDYARRAGRPYRFVYGAGVKVPGDFTDCLVKLDLDRGIDQTWYEPGCYPGEPVFVATGNAKAEDDGVILSVVLDCQKGASFLLILDAATFHELARAEVPCHVPLGFHGEYLPA